MDIFGILMFFMCNVIVFDGELIDIVLLNVVINNINDNILIFIILMYEFSVFVDIVVNDIIGLVIVIDDDIGEFGNCFFLD